MKGALLILFMSFGIVAMINTARNQEIENILTKPNYASPEMMQVLADYSIKPIPTIKNGLYKSTIIINTNSFFSSNSPITYSIFIDSNQITAQLNIPEHELSAQLKTNYHYDGGVWRYSNMKGDIFLLTQDGNAIQSYDNGFAMLIGFCNDKDYKVTGDYLCKNNQEFIIFKPAR